MSTWPLRSSSATLAGPSATTLKESCGWRWDSAVRIAGTQMDITARKQAELALQESEARYRTVVESAPVAMLIYVDQRVAMANPACVKLFRAGSEQELLGRDIWSLSSPECHPLVRQRIERAMLRGEENPVAELEIQCLDGTRLPVEGVSVPIEYRGGRAMHAIMADATPRKQADTPVLHRSSCIPW